MASSDDIIKSSSDDIMIQTLALSLEILLHVSQSPGNLEIIDILLMPCHCSHTKVYKPKRWILVGLHAVQLGDPHTLE